MPGASWIVGDEVGVAVTVRNRTDRALPVALRVAPSGTAALVEPAAGACSLTVAARSTATAVVRVRAGAVGTAALEVSVTAPGVPPDSVRHQWQVTPAGEARVDSNGIWVDRSATLASPAVGAGSTATGAGRLVDRGR